MAVFIKVELELAASGAVATDGGGGGYGLEPRGNFPEAEIPGFLDEIAGEGAIVLLEKRFQHLRADRRADAVRTTKQFTLYDIELIIAVMSANHVWDSSTVCGKMLEQTCVGIDFPLADALVILAPFFRFVGDEFIAKFFAKGFLDEGICGESSNGLVKGLR